MKRIVVFFISLLVCSTTYAVTLTQQQYNQILDRLKKDKEVMQQNDVKWEELRKQIPQVEYKVTDNGVVVEKITIPVKNDNPLEYQSEFTIISKDSTEGFFPLKLRLYGGIEANPTIGETIQPDVKLAVKLIGLKPLKIPVIKNFGLNVMAGIKGFGGSLSYDLPKPVSNTAIHIYAGTSYTWKYQIGLGVSLNF